MYIRALILISFLWACFSYAAEGPTGRPVIVVGAGNMGFYVAASLKLSGYRDITLISESLGDQAEMPIAIYNTSQDFNESLENVIPLSTTTVKTRTWTSFGAIPDNALVVVATDNMRLEGKGGTKGVAIG